MSLYKSFLKDNASTIVTQMFMFLQGIVLVPLMIKSVGVAIYGGYSLLNTTLGLLFGISSFGVGFRYKRFFPTAPDLDARQTLFYPQLLFQVASVFILGALFVLSGPAITATLFKNEVHFSTFLAFGYLFAFLLYSQSTDYFRYTSRIHYTNAMAVSMVVFQVCFVLFFFEFRNAGSIDSVLTAQILALSFVSLPFLPKILREINFRPLFYTRDSISGDLKFGFPLILSYLLQTILYSGDRYLISLFMNVTQVGYYGPAYTLGSIILFLPMATGMVLPQLLSKAVDLGNIHQGEQIVNYTIRGLLLLGLPFVFGSCVMAEPLLTIFANRDVAMHAHWVVPIVAFGSLFYGLVLILSNVLFVRMKTAAIFRINVTTALLNVVLNLIFLTLFRDIVVAAVTTLVSYFVAFVLMYRSLSADWKIRFDWNSTFKSIVAGGIMAAALHFAARYWLGNDFYSRSLFTFLAATLCALFLNTAVLIALRAFSAKEIAFLKDFFRAA